MFREPQRFRIIENLLQQTATSFVSGSRAPHMADHIVASLHKMLLFPGDPLYVGMDLTIASFDAISEVNMVFIISINYLYTINP